MDHYDESRIEDPLVLSEDLTNKSTIGGFHGYKDDAYRKSSFLSKLFFEWAFKILRVNRI